MFQGKAAVQTIPLRSSLGIFSERSDNSDVVDSDVEKSYRLVDWTDWSSRVLYSEVGSQVSSRECRIWTTYNALRV